MNSEPLIRATLTERILMRQELLSNFGEIKMFPVGDIIACDVVGIITEHTSYRELFEYLADLVEES